MLQTNVYCHFYQSRGAGVARRSLRLLFTAVGYCSLLQANVYCHFYQSRGAAVARRGSALAMIVDDKASPQEPLLILLIVKTKLLKCLRCLMNSVRETIVRQNAKVIDRGEVRQHTVKIFRISKPTIPCLLLRASNSCLSLYRAICSRKGCHDFTAASGFARNENGRRIHRKKKYSRLNLKRRLSS